MTGETRPGRLPFQRLDERMAGVPLRETLLPGVPPYLEDPLRAWLAEVLDDNDHLAMRVAVRLGWDAGGYTYPLFLYEQTAAEDLLLVVDAVLQLHPAWDAGGSLEADRRFGALFGFVLQLSELLHDGASEFTVDLDAGRLVRRVDETATAAAARAGDIAPKDAAGHLQAAWAAAYGIQPDPDTAYREAVKAVEALAVPLVLPASAAAGKATLGTVIGELKNNSGHKWQFVIPGQDGEPQDAERIVVMLELLWQGQVSRHAGGHHNRPQTQAEAEAAVHLAAVLVQWLSSNAFQRRR